MKIINSYTYGIKEAISTPKIVFLLWIISFGFGSIIYFPLSGLLENFWGKSALAESLVERGDSQALFELFVQEANAMGPILSVALIIVPLFFFVGLFLRGGVLFTLVRRLSPEGQESGRERLAKVFFQGAGKFFGRFFRLTIYSLLLWIGFVIIVFLLNAIRRIIIGESGNEQLAFYLFLAQVGIALLFGIFIKLILDYSRIKIVIRDDRRVFRSMLAAAGFVTQKIIRAFVLFFLLVLTGIVLIFIFWRLQLAIAGHTALAIICAFILSQLSIGSRWGMAVALAGGEIKFYSVEASGDVLKDSGGKRDQGLKEVKDSGHRESDQTEGEKQKPNEGVEDKGE